MNTSSDAAEQIVRISLEGFEVAAKITGSASKDIAVLLYTLMKDKEKTAGKTTLTNMLKSGKELKVFSVKSNEFKKFTEEAKRYGVLYSALINKKDKNNDGVIDIMVRAEDAAKINRIVERFKLSSYEEASIRSEIEKTRLEKVKEDNTNPIHKDGEIVNPHLAKTEKSPQSKPSLETQEISNKGTRFKKSSVKEKIKEITKEVKIRDESRQIETTIKVPKKDKKDKTL